MSFISQYISFTTAQWQTVILAVGLWAWFFILAPFRSFKVGVMVGDMPAGFKMAPFKLVRNVALIVMAALAYFFPLQPDALTQLDRAFISNEDMMAPPLAVLLSGGLLLAGPALVAMARRRKELPAGGWSTPALSYYGWNWLGFVLVMAMGLPQAFVPPLQNFIAFPMTVSMAISLGVIGVSIYLVWWGLPGMDLERQAQSGDPAAMSELLHARWVGLPVWVIYRLQASHRRVVSDTGGNRKLCPSCMRPIDRLDDYHSLDFDHCPHCKELVPAVFNLHDYIVTCANEALVLRSNKGKSKSAARRADKLEEDFVQRIFRALLTFGLRERATDIHIGNDSNQLQIRMRIDGVLQTLFSMDLALGRMIISVVKVMSRMDISETRKPQDGSFKTTVDDTKLDVRVNTSPTSEGETASLRLVYQSRCLGSLDNLGMAGRARGIVEQSIRHPHGLFLVTGPTGSGKSTTLYNSLAAITDGKRNIITLEDPIEFKIDGITQMQIDVKKHFDFASGLRTILRQDPDVIMVGEVRDEETAKMAVDASMTGHLVLTTLHTIDTTTAVGRLFDLGVDPHQHAEALLLIVAQRLVRLICRHCSEEYAVSRDELAAMGMPDGPAKLLLRRGVGCEHCFHSGYFEREGIYELLQATPPLRTLIANRAAPYDIRDEARREGMRTLLEDGLTKVIVGRTTIEEVLRVTS